MSRSTKKSGKPSLSIRAFLFFAALLLVPACTALLRTMRRVEEAHKGQAVPPFALSKSLTAFAGGLLVFTVPFLFKRIPSRWYVAIHELTHAFAGMLCGSKVSKLKIADEHGSVKVSHPNAFTLLAPYFMPLPAGALLIVAACFSAVLPLGDAAIPLAAGFGVLWGFHFCFTVNAMLQGQTDLDAYGFFFSVVTVVFLNVAFLFLAQIVLCSSRVNPFSTLLQMWTETLAWFLPK